MRITGIFLLFFSLPQFILPDVYAQKRGTGQTFFVQSPDKKISVEVTVKNGEAMYNIRYGKNLVLQNSALGVVREDADFSKGLQYESATKNVHVKDSYQTGREK